ncbi:Six-hairpin glycosidase-like protein [Hysterangium stoloniferum]|nr:Six-hairpin glycosidase-like protein [Hysterangium stoloniferum]
MDILREKIHSGISVTPTDSSTSQATPDLTINIPTPAASPWVQKPPSKLKQNISHEAPSLEAIPQVNKVEDEEQFTTYREKLFDQLGADYQGVERYRLSEDEAKERHWKRWGPYLSERQWATVREDYSANGDAWSYFPHAHARSRAYRWGEDGLAGISDNHQRLCFSLALWNGVDPILKERLFGVTGHEGNHGEDVKELYWYLDSTPTHSYMKFLYKYPQREFPYEKLTCENQNRGRDAAEFEILDTDVFEDDRYWDVFVEYAKDAEDPDSIAIRITAFNRGPDPATLHILPQLWFPNTWSWPLPEPPRPSLSYVPAKNDLPQAIYARHDKVKTRLWCSPSPLPVSATGESPAIQEEQTEGIVPEIIFTDNDTNFKRLYHGNNASPYVKDAFHDHIIPSHRPKSEPYGNDHTDYLNSRVDNSGDVTPMVGSRNPTPEPQQPLFVNPDKTGTKAGAHYIFRGVPGDGGCVVVRLKLTPLQPAKDRTIYDEDAFDNMLEERRVEADEFYQRLVTGPITDDLRQITRQALAGMLWSKQYYQFIQNDWIKGDPAQPPPPPERKFIRNKEWGHMYVADVLSMPDKWDTAFHCIPLAMVDPAFAKKQLDLLTREWYMKPDGQIPAYEWNFSDVNPPVHAWATFRIFKIERKLHGREDLQFLERVFQKLLLNFTWWVNRKDQGGNNVFEGGFLGLDNIGAFNRSEPLPTGGVLRQADGTAWMAFFCLNMLNMALELAKHNSVYEDIASKFFEHFIFIADAMTFKNEGENEESLWNENDGFYYDAIHFGSGRSQQLAIRSLVGLIPLYATLTLEPAVINRFPGFKKRMEWFIDNRPEVAQRNMANMKVRGKGERRLLALASKERLIRILSRALDEGEFLSEHGIRSLSLHHKKNPYNISVNGESYEVAYWPGDSHSGMFGGNSNWRGPIWLAVNFLIIESLQRFHQYYGDDLQACLVECPTGSGDYMNLANVAEEIQHRIIHIFGRDPSGRRATNGGNMKLDFDPHFRDYVHFYEFFHGDSGKGLGASHQTGWTGLVAFHIMQTGITCRLPKTPRTPRSVAQHYFDEHIESRSAQGDDSTINTPYTNYSEVPTLSDLSPDAL